MCDRTLKIKKNMNKSILTDVNSNTDIFYKGKHIGYYHKSGKKYIVYHDNVDDPEDFTQSDEVSSKVKAKKMAVNTAKANGMIEADTGPMSDICDRIEEDIKNITK